MEKIEIAQDGTLTVNVNVGNIDPAILAVMQLHLNDMIEDASDYCTCDDCQEDLKAIKKDIKAFKRVLAYFGRIDF